MSVNIENNNQLIAEIFEGIQNHLNFLEGALKTAEEMYHFSLKKDVDQVTNLADNFERILNIISRAQRSIEQQIYLLSPGSVSAGELEILKLWVQEVNLLTEKINEVDNKTLDQLDQIKTETGTEIGAVFSNKEKIKGYSSAQGKK